VPHQARNAELLFVVCICTVQSVLFSVWGIEVGRNNKYLRYNVFLVDAVSVEFSSCKWSFLL